MAVTVDAVSTTGNWEADGSVTADLPANSAGQLLVAATFARLAAQTINLPSASPGVWALLSGDNDSGTNSSGEIAGKTAGGSETAPTLSSGLTGGPQGTGGIIFAISGWTGTLGDILYGVNSGGSATLQAPSVLAAPDGSLILRIYFNADANAIVTPPSGSQVFTQVVTPGLGRLGLHVYSQTQAGAGATGTANLVMNASDGFLAYTVVIPPSAAGPPTDASAGNAAGSGAAIDPGGAVSAGIGNALSSGAALNPAPLIGAAANSATAVAVALQPSTAVAALAGCAEADGDAYNAVFAIPSAPAGPRITSTTPRGRITTSTPSRITTTSPRGLL